MDFEVSELQGAEARIEELEEKLAAQTRLLRTIIDNLPMAIYARARRAEKYWPTEWTWIITGCRMRLKS